jgi:hypothetical protein
MLKELVARIAIVLFIIGLTSEVTQNGESSSAVKQPRADRSPNAADILGEP